MRILDKVNVEVNIRGSVKAMAKVGINVVKITVKNVVNGSVTQT